MYFPVAVEAAVTLQWGSLMATTGDHTEAIDPAIVITTAILQNTETVTGHKSAVRATTLILASGDQGLKLRPHEAGPQAEDNFRAHILYSSYGIYEGFSPDIFASNLWAEQQ